MCVPTALEQVKFALQNHTVHEWVYQCVCVALPHVHRCALSRQVFDLIRHVAGLLRQVVGHIRQVAILIRLVITVQCFRYYTAGGVTNMPILYHVSFSLFHRIYCIYISISS